MAKKDSSDIVDETAEYERRFEKLEKDAETSRTLLEKLAGKLLKDEPAPETKKKTDEPKPETKTSGGFVGFMQDMGIFSREAQK